ncbi:MAG: putative phosphotransferase enzyme family [Verrucomicrobiales bacterium]|nr:putative phosphotransferase enzyme family [Verrucomicrobiales bacterium]
MSITPESMVVRSVISPGAVGAAIESDYSLGRVLDCQLHAVNLNEHYELLTSQGKYFVRLYGRCAYWASTKSELSFELEYLLFLAGAGIPVSTPVARKDNQLLGQLLTPEGLRFYAVFTFAVGRQNYPPSIDESARLGKYVGQIHKATVGYDSRHSRIEYNLEQLLDDSIQRICKFLGSERSEHQAFLVKLGKELKRAELPKTPEFFGVIGGGFLGTNHHVTDAGDITLFQFDFCGYGWRIYELAHFLWHAKLYHAPLEIWDAFLGGYQSVRVLSAMELNRIDAFVKIKHIFTMGYHTTYANWMGDCSFDDFYWDKHFEPLKTWS